MNRDEELYQEVQNEFQDRKASSASLVESYRRLGMYDRADKVMLCGTDLQFIAPEDESEGAKLFQANFCKDRLCWMCSWRRTMKVFGQVSQVMDELERRNQYRYVFLTLTVRNVSGPLLRDTVDELFRAFHRFNQRAAVKRAFKGGFRTLEITYHPEYPTDIEFHPHLHAIYVVNKSYFKSSSYLSHAALMQIWRECMALDYDPVVHVEVVRPDDSDADGISYSKAVAEVATYSVKPEEVYVHRTEDEIDRGVWYISQAIGSRRLCSFTGVMKEVAAELKFDDLLDGDLVHTDNEELRADVGRVIIRYQWQVGVGYVKTKVWKEQPKEKEKKDADCGARNRISRKLWREKVKTVYASRLSRKS